MIYNYLIKAIDIKKISPFLKYLTNNLIKDENIDFNYRSTENLYEDLINNIENYLKQILLKNHLTIEDIYKDSLIKSKGKGYDFRGVFLYLCNQSNQIDKELLNKISFCYDLLIKENVKFQLIYSFYQILIIQYL